MHEYSQDYCQSMCGVSSQQKQKMLKNISNLLRFIVECINNSQMYFICTNTIKTIVEVCVVSSHQKLKMLKILFLLTY